MKIKLLTTVGTLGNRYPEGEVCEVEDRLAAQWIKGGWAEAVSDAPAQAPHKTPRRSMRRASVTAFDQNIS